MIEQEWERPGEGAISSSSWEIVKNLFWELQPLQPQERERLLGSRDVSRQVREYATKLLDAAESVGERFGNPASSSLGVMGQDDDALGEAAGATLVGRTLGKYRVVRRIGQGGMGAVYEALRSDDAYDQRVAIKTLWRGADSSVLLQRFRSERQILAGLEHPNIARLIDGGTTEEGAPYLVMEMVDGVTIDKFCDSHALGITARLDLFRQVCAAVQHAHRNLVVHRDLKPSNVLVTENGTVKLLDFGVAKLIDDPRSAGTLTGAGLSPFTRAYAAPEQIDGRSVSTVTDVYSLGALLYVLLTGEAPFAESHPYRGAASHRIARAPSSTTSDDAARARGLSSGARLARALRGDLDAITLAALREDPARRYATVDALSEDVHRFLRGERVLATPDTLSYRARVFIRRRRALVIAASVAAVALMVLSSVAFYQMGVSHRETVRTQRVAQFLTLMTGSPDARTGRVLVRHGTLATTTEMLDSALRRVPSTFPDDPDIRARLYTAIGASYVAQSRMRAAANVLDSATYLARRSFGLGSDEFAEASIAAADAAIHRSPVPVAMAFARNALAAFNGRAAKSPELYSRALVTMATVRYLAADYRGADALARDAIAAELSRTRSPTLTRAWALRLRAGVRLFHQDWRGTDSLSAHAVAIADSLGDPFALERLDALFERSEARRFGMGDSLLADSLTNLALDAAQRGYGPHSREAAIFLAQASTFARLHGDTAASRAMSETALRIVDSIPDVNSQVRVGVNIFALTDLWARRRFATADSLGHRLLSRAAEQEDPMAIAMATAYAGAASIYAGKLPNAEQDFRLGLRACAGRDELEWVCRTLRRQLAVTLGTMGRRAEAERIFRLLPAVDAAQGRAIVEANLAKAATRGSGRRNKQ